MIIQGFLTHMKYIARFDDKTARAIRAHPHLRTLIDVAFVTS